MRGPRVVSILTSRMPTLVCGFASLTACTTINSAPRGLGSGDAYVAMGSSFAAGPGVTVSADDPPNRCTRSHDNYAHLLARKLTLRLTDVSCGGATTRHVLGRWDELPPQVDALTADTRLVTITIGGNDVGYIGTLMSGSCRTFAAPPPGTPGGKCPVPSIPVDAWTQLERGMRAIAREVRTRAPHARLMFVDYLTVLPAHGPCASTPLPPGVADASTATARRLADLTAKVAAETGNEVLRASAMSQAHSACSADPWTNGFPLSGGKGFVPYHPTARGMEVIADALAHRLRLATRE